MPERMDKNLIMKPCNFCKKVLISTYKYQKSVYCSEECQRNDGWELIGTGEELLEPGESQKNE